MMMRAMNACAIAFFKWCPLRVNEAVPPRRTVALSGRGERTRASGPAERVVATRARTSSAQAPERSGKTWGKCPEKARSRSGHALVASWSYTGSFDDHAHAVALRVSGWIADKTVTGADNMRRPRD